MNFISANTIDGIGVLINIDQIETIKNGDGYTVVTTSADVLKVKAPIDKFVEAIKSLCED